MIVKTPSKKITTIVSLTLYRVISPFGGSGLLHVNVMLKTFPMKSDNVSIRLSGAVGTRMVC